MIVAEQKSFADIYEIVKSHKSVLILGCGTCVTVCMSGGEKEVGILADQIRLAARERGDAIEVAEHTIVRQCDSEFFDELTVKKMRAADIVLSLGCGVGVQFSMESVEGVSVYPGLNTQFYGATQEQGVWAERCAGCGDCTVDQFGGICPVARCSKSIMNGPCGGTEDGRCEADPDRIQCAWQLIYDRMEKLGRLKELEKIHPVKDWSSNRDGGPRKKIRKDVLKSKK